MAARNNGEERVEQEVRVEQEANLAEAPGSKRNNTDKILVESKRQVTFSKRRNGLFKKLSELATLTGAEVAGIVYSPGGKVFTFGHPSPDAVFRKFLDEELEPQPGDEMTERLVQERRSARQGQSNFYLTQLNEMINDALRKGEEISRERRETEGKVWWERPKKELNLQQLELSLMKYKALKHGLDAELLQLRQEKEELNGGVGFGVGVPVPSNVMGGGGTDGGQVIDPKGKGSAGGLQSGLVSFDPMVGGSSSQAPLDPNHALVNPIHGGSGVPFNPMAVGSSSQVPQDPGTLGFYGGPPYDPMASGSNGVTAFNQMGMGSNDGSGMPFKLNPSGGGGLPYIYDPMASGSNAPATFNLMGMGSNDGSGMPFNLNPSGGGGPYDPMASGSNVAAAFTEMGMGSTDGSGMPFNLNPSSGGGLPYDPMASGSNAARPFDQLWMRSINGSGMPFNLNPSGGIGPPYYPMASGSNGGATIGQMQTGSTDGSGMPFNLNPSGGNY